LVRSPFQGKQISHNIRLLIFKQTERSHGKMIFLHETPEKLIIATRSANDLFERGSHVRVWRRAGGNMAQPTPLLDDGLASSSGILSLSG
jgi:hypothetical protein